MERTISAGGHGFCLFSFDKLTEFLSTKKIRSKKVLALLQKKKDLYLETIENGIWMPIPSIDFYKYVTQTSHIKITL